MGSLLVDTNFFFDCLRFGIPLDEIEKFGEVFIPENVRAEIQGLSLKGREEVFRRIILEWIGRFRVYPLGGKVDESFLELARTKRITVATNDSRLKRSLKSLGSEVIFIRSRSHLELF